MVHAKARVRNRLLWAGGGLVAVLLLAAAAYLYPGVRLAWEILHTPTQPLVLSKWDTMRLKALRRSLVNNQQGVHEGSFCGRGGSTLAYVDIEPANYSFEATVQKTRSDFVVDYRYAIGENVEPVPARGVVFILHGYGLCKEIMLPWGMALARQGYRMVLLDLPAHGASSPGTVGFGRKDAELLKEFCDDYRLRVGAPRMFTAVLGCSYGASVAMHLGVLDPNVGAIVAIAPFGNLETAIRGFGGSLSLALPDHAAEVASYLVKAWSGDDGMSFNVDEARQPPALFVRPEHDLVTPDDEFRTLVENAYPNAEVEVVRGIGHLEAGLPFASSVARVLEFLDGASHKQYEPGVVECITE